MTTALKKNKEYSNRYVQQIKNPEIPPEIDEILETKKIKSLIDLGCGDGIFIHALKRKYPKLKIVGIDISERRIKGLKKKFPNDKFYCRDVCNTKLKEKFDFVYSSQVLEHVESDKKMINEMKKLLKNNGTLFVSSVIKKPWAIYKYRNNGKFTLDPTPEKEYSNKEEFLDLFKKDFRLIKLRISKTTRRKFGLTFHIPGFFEIHGFWKKR